ncbi:MAG: hypothetical protein VX764_02710 [Planctomycetota bacterium]|nr:hypothetical protein [Planctomycetota bacterium]
MALRILALVGAATMVLEILVARQLATVLGSSLDGVALAVNVALVGFTIGLIAAARVRERRSMATTWCRIALLGCIAAALWIGVLLPRLVEDTWFISTLWGKILVSLPLLCGSIPLGAAVTVSFNASVEQVMSRSSSGVAALDLGSAFGAIITPLLLLPISGELGTLIVGLLLLGLASFGPEIPGRTESETVRKDRRVSRRAILSSFWVGVIAFALQLGWVRVLGEVLGSSLLVFGFASGMWLIGGAAGAVLMPQLRQTLGISRLRRFAWSSWLVSQGISLLLIAFSPYLYLHFVSLIGETPGSWLPLAKLLMLLVVLGLPGFCSGLIIPALMVDHGEKGRLDRGAGFLQGSNLIGSMVGASLAAFWIIPTRGPLFLFMLCGFGTVAAGVPAMRRGSRGGAASSFLCGGLLLAGASQFWEPDLLSAGIFQWSRKEIVDGVALEGWKQREILGSFDGHLGRVQIERDPNQNTSYLRIGGRIEGSVPIDPTVPSLADLPTEVMLGLLPSWVGPGKGDLLIVGLGGGTTVATAVDTWDGNLVVAEIEPAVKEALLSDAGREAFPIEHRALFGLKAPSIVLGDARALLARDGRLWDAIVIQPSEPWLPWSAPLFTPDFHQLLSRRLAAEGVVIQWLQLYRIGVAEFAAILSSFRQELGPVQVWHPPGTGEILLVAGKTVPAGENRRETIEQAWSRVSAGPLPLLPWLDDPVVERWLLQAGGSDSKRLRARLEHRLPLLGEGGRDQSGQLLRSLQESLQNQPRIGQD